jgi:hypothetical protein
MDEWMTEYFLNQKKNREKYRQTYKNIESHRKV